MPRKSSIVIGKTVRKASRLRGGDGSALPGLVIEKIDKNFVKNCLSQLPKGVVVISGTNGKTTTTKIVVELLESKGLKVLTNSTGSNFVRGVIAAILESINIKGELNADIAVLELDEAHSVKFTEIIKPQYSLLLNVMHDQLDRFGSIDHVAGLLSKLAAATSKTVVINREDSRLVNIKSPATISYYGLSPALRPELLEKDDSPSHNPAKSPKAAITLEQINGQNITLNINGKKHSADLSVKGIYNAYNAAAALTLIKQILPKADDDQLIKSLSNIKPALGRGESIVVNNTEVEVLLVKNPAGFQLALKSFTSKKHDFMIAINNAPADGRDSSWLTDVDFSNLPHVQTVSGTCAVDVALRLERNGVSFSTTNEDLNTAVISFLRSSTKPKRIFCNYTAMLQIRKHLSKLAKAKKTP
jgi:UDP-N-acetylmuramyl tripeptide synthase